MKPKPTLYDAAFYESQAQGSLASARIVVPLLMQYFRPRRVVDIGCGLGTWLKAFLENGVAEVKGYDGLHVDQSELLIDPALFATADLSRPLRITDRADLAVCLEVAEHLPPFIGDQLVHTLTRTAPCVLFSAAVPNQGGIGHINERWPTYWRRIFAAQGYRRLDILRPRIWQDRTVDWWYRQNLFLYANDEAIATFRALQQGAERGDNDLELIYPGILYRHDSLQGLLQDLPKLTWRAIKRRLGLHA
jgi:SAM-dependent methyltransferase